MNRLSILLLMLFATAGTLSAQYGGFDKLILLPQRDENNVRKEKELHYKYSPTTVLKLAELYYDDYILVQKEKELLYELEMLEQMGYSDKDTIAAIRACFPLKQTFPHGIDSAIKYFTMWEKLTQDQDIEYPKFEKVYWSLRQLYQKKDSILAQAPPKSPNDTNYLPYWYFAVDENHRMRTDISATEMINRSRLYVESYTELFTNWNEPNIYDSTLQKGQVFIRMVFGSSFGSTCLLRLERVGDEMTATFKSGKNMFEPETYYGTTKKITSEQWEQYMNDLANIGFPHYIHVDDLFQMVIDGDALFIETKDDSGYHAYFTLDPSRALKNLFWKLYKLPK